MTAPLTVSHPVYGPGKVNRRRPCTDQVVTSLIEVGANIRGILIVAAYQ